MADILNKPINNGEKKVERNPDGTVKKGTVLNPNGRPIGAKNFDTLFKEALKRISDANSKDPDEFDIEIVAKGLESARKGDFRFWKDLLDRRFGKSKESIDHTSGGERIEGFNVMFKSFKKENGDKRYTS